MPATSRLANAASEFLANNPIPNSIPNSIMNSTFFTLIITPLSHLFATFIIVAPILFVVVFIWRCVYIDRLQLVRKLNTEGGNRYKLWKCYSPTLAQFFSPWRSGGYATWFIISVKSSEPSSGFKFSGSLYNYSNIHGSEYHFYELPYPYRQILMHEGRIGDNELLNILQGVVRREDSKKEEDKEKTKTKK